MSKFLTLASLIQIEEIAWLWTRYIVKGALNIIAGRPGAGKTSLALDIAAIVSRGATFPDGERCEAGKVIIWAVEDHASSVIVPKLKVAGADLENILILGGAEAGINCLSFKPSRDAQELIDEICEHGGVSLIIIDPLTTVIRGDSHRNTEVRESLEPLMAIAAETGAAILGITHLRKGSQGTNPLERLNGSIAFGAVPRSVLFVASTMDDDKTTRGIVTIAKPSYGPPGGGFGFRLVPTKDNFSRFSFLTKVQWSDVEEQGPPEALIAKIEGSGNFEIDSAVGEAMALLKEHLKDRKEKSSLVIAAAKAEGISDSAFGKARRLLDVKKERIGSEWFMYLKEPKQH